MREKALESAREEQLHPAAKPVTAERPKFVPQATTKPVKALSQPVKPGVPQPIPAAKPASTIAVKPAPTQPVAKPVAAPIAAEAKPGLRQAATALQSIDPAFVQDFLSVADKAISEPAQKAKNQIDAITVAKDTFSKNPNAITYNMLRGALIKAGFGLSSKFPPTLPKAK